MIYIIRAVELNRVKIGTTSGPSVAQRLSQLRTGCPTELALLVTFEGDHAEESKLHRQFAYLRTHGEWFEYTGALRLFVEEKCSDQEAIQEAREYAERAEQFKKLMSRNNPLVVDEDDSEEEVMAKAADILKQLNEKYGSRNALGEIHDPDERLRVVGERFLSGLYQEGICGEPADDDEIEGDD